jgi:hypothetical protein
MLTERYGHDTYSYYLKYSEWHIVQVFRPLNIGKGEDDKIILCTAILLCNVECRVTFAPLCIQKQNKKSIPFVEVHGEGIRHSVDVSFCQKVT